MSYEINFEELNRNLNRSLNILERQLKLKEKEVTPTTSKWVQKATEKAKIRESTEMLAVDVAAMYKGLKSEGLTDKEAALVTGEYYGNLIAAVGPKT